MTTKQNKTEVVEVQATSNAPVTPMSLVQIAVEQNADLDKLEKLLALQEKWEANEARKAFNQAIAKFRAECPAIKKTKEVDYSSKGGRTHYKHADLAGALKQIQPLMSECGLSHSWKTEQSDGLISVTCIVTHKAGHSESTTMIGPYDQSGGKNAIQAIGSTTTYLQRYTLFSILGLAAEDDDDGAGSSDAGYSGDVVAEFQKAKDKKELHAIWNKLNDEQKAQYRSDLDARLGELA